MACVDQHETALTATPGSPCGPGLPASPASPCKKRVKKSPNNVIGQKRLLLDGVVFFRYILRNLSFQSSTSLNTLMLNFQNTWCLLPFHQRPRLNPLHQGGLVNPVDVSKSHSEK